MTIVHMPTPAVTTPVSSVCLECGTFKKSGKISCCGRGGSWFGNCGSVGSIHFDHTWYEGIRACKSRQSDQQLHAYNNGSMGIKSKAAAVATYMFASTPADTSTPMPCATPITVLTSTSIAPVRTTTAYGDNKSAYKAIIAATTKIRHTSVHTSTPKSTIPGANGTNTPKVNGKIFKSVRTASGNMSMKTSSHALASASRTARECAQSLHTVTRIIMALSILC